MLDHNYYPSILLFAFGGLYICIPRNKKKRQIYLSLSLCNYLLDMHTQSSFSDGPSIYS